MKRFLIISLSGVFCCYGTIDWQNPPAPKTIVDWVDAEVCKEVGGTPCTVADCWGFHYPGQVCCCGMKNIPISSVSQPNVYGNEPELKPGQQPATQAVVSQDLSGITPRLEQLKSLVTEVHTRVEHLEKEMGHLVQGAAPSTEPGK